LFSTTGITEHAPATKAELPAGVLDMCSDITATDVIFTTQFLIHQSWHFVENLLRFNTNSFSAFDALTPVGWASGRASSL